MDRIGLFAEFIYESDLIENIQDDKEVLKRQLAGGKEDGHAGAILYLEKSAKNKKHFLAEADIKAVQGLITAEQGIKRPDLKLPEKWIGNYRDCGCCVGGDRRPEPGKVPGLMENLVRQIQDWQMSWRKFSEIQNLAIMADIHYQYEIIHPFADGNGRSGRAIILYLFLYMDKEPFVFTAYDKFLFYYPSFAKRDTVIMRNYFYRKSGNLS